MGRVGDGDIQPLLSDAASRARSNSEELLTHDSWDTSQMRSHLIEVYSQERSAEAECSIVVPIYNGSRFLPDSIPSVLGQDEIICDILLSDDCSEDGSLDAVLGLVRRYSGPHSVRVYRTSERPVVEHTRLR